MFNLVSIRDDLFSLFSLQFFSIVAIGFVPLLLQFIALLIYGFKNAAHS